jgi:hypothetical protein
MVERVLLFSVRMFVISKFRKPKVILHTRKAFLWKWSGLIEGLQAEAYLDQSEGDLDIKNCLCGVYFLIQEKISLKYALVNIEGLR